MQLNDQIHGAKVVSEEIARYMSGLPWKVVEGILTTVLSGIIVTLLSSGVSYIFKLKSTTLEAVVSVWENFSSLTNGNLNDIGGNALEFARDFLVFFAVYIIPAAIFVFILSIILSIYMTGFSFLLTGHIPLKNIIIPIVISSILLPLPGFKLITQLIALFVNPIVSLFIWLGALVITANALKFVAIPIVAWLDKVPLSQVWSHYFIELTSNAGNTMPSAGVILIGIYLISAGIGFGFAKYTYEYIDDNSPQDFLF